MNISRPPVLRDLFLCCWYPDRMTVLIYHMLLCCESVAVKTVHAITQFGLQSAVTQIVQNRSWQGGNVLSPTVLSFHTAFGRWSDSPTLGLVLLAVLLVCNQWSSLSSRCYRILRILWRSGKFRNSFHNNFKAFCAFQIY